MTQRISEQQIQAFRRDGFLTYPVFFSQQELAQIETWTAEIAAWAGAQPERAYHYFERTDAGPALARSENFVPYHADVRRLLTQGRLVAALSDLFGEPAVLFKEKINYKLPGGGGFAPHQDAIAYKFGTAHITCLIAIDDSREDNGCLWFARGEHARGLLGTNQAGCLAPDVVQSLEWEPAPVAAGGVVFFDSYIPHRSDANDSTRSRRALYVTYNRAREGDFRERYYHDRAQEIATFEARHEGQRRISTIGHFQGQSIE